MQKIKEPKFRLIIFDMDNTLYEFRNNEKDIYKTAFFDEVRRNAIVFIADKLSKNVDEAERIYNDTLPDTSIRLEKDFGIPVSEYFSATWNVDPSRYVDQNPELRALLANLSCKKVLLTAAPRAWAERVIKHLNIYDMFDALYFGDAKIRKPSAESFEKILEEFGVAAKDTLFIDDEPKCILAARRLGIKTALRRDTDEQIGDYTLKKIFDISNIV